MDVCGGIGICWDRGREEVGDGIEKRGVGGWEVYGGKGWEG